jgi:hypothetical protein
MKSLYLLPLLLLCACASIVDGKNQQMSVETSPGGASCTLNNDQGKWYVESPGSVTIQRSLEDLKVYCKKSDLSGKATVVSGVKGVAFGNILAGGIIGVAIDRSNGSAFEYPQNITIPMSAKGESIRIEPPKVEESAESTQYPSQRKR